jgi:hypothetical protein
MKHEFIHELQNNQSRYFSQDDFDLGFDPLGDEISSIEGKIDEYEDEYDITCYHTSPYPVESLIKREYCATDKDYFNLYTYECSGVYFIYSKYLNDLFRQSISQSSLEWVIIDDIGYYYEYSFFWREFKYDFEESNNPELVDDTYFAPFIEDDPHCLAFSDLDYFEIILSAEELDDFFQNKFYDDLYSSECLIENSLYNFTKKEIFNFKMWFSRKFAYGFEIKEENHIKYKWTDSFTKKIMHMSLKFLDHEYEQYRNGGFSQSSDRLQLFLESVASTPLEADLFKHIEDDFGIFDDED